MYVLDCMHKGIKLQNQITIELNHHRAVLRNYINLYSKITTVAQTDDLVAAIIADNLLTEDDIRFVFAMDANKWTQCKKRITER